MCASAQKLWNYCNVLREDSVNYGGLSQDEGLMATDEHDAGFNPSEAQSRSASRRRLDDLFQSMLLRAFKGEP